MLGIIFLLASLDDIFKQVDACISISLELCIFSKISEYIMMMDAYPLGGKDFILCIINLSIECTNVCYHYLLNIIAMWNAIQKNGYSFGANLELTCDILHWNEFMFNFCHVTCQMWSVNVDGKKIQMFAWILFDVADIHHILTCKYIILLLLFLYVRFRFLYKWRNACNLTSFKSNFRA